MLYVIIVVSIISLGALIPLFASEHYDVGDTLIDVALGVLLSVMIAAMVSITSFVLITGNCSADSVSVHSYKIVAIQQDDTDNTTVLYTSKGKGIPLGNTVGDNHDTHVFSKLPSKMNIEEYHYSKAKHFWLWTPKTTYSINGAE